MSSDIDLEAQGVAQAAPCAGAFFSFLPLSFLPEALTFCEKEVGGSETPEMAILQSHASTVTSAALPMSTGQDVEDKARPVVSQAVVEAWDATSTPTCSCIPSGVFRPFTSMRGGSDIGYSQRCGVDDATGDQPTQGGEAQTRVYFPTTIEIWLT